MNAPFPPPAVAPTAYDRAHADGELGAGLTMLDYAKRSLDMAAWHIDRAVSNGSGEKNDLKQMERIAGELAVILRSVEVSASVINVKLGSAE